MILFVPRIEGQLFNIATKKSQRSEYEQKLKVEHLFKCILSKMSTAFIRIFRKNPKICQMNVEDMVA